MHARVTVVCCHSFIHSLCVNKGSRRWQTYALREEELRLDDNLSPFSGHCFNFSLVIFEKTREKADYSECCCTTMPIQLFSCQRVLT